jgi:hypothetical protein
VVAARQQFVRRQRGAFFLDLVENLPRHLRLRGLRGDAGFCRPELLALWEELRLPYMVAAQLRQPVQKLIKRELPRAADRSGRHRSH